MMRCGFCDGKDEPMVASNHQGQKSYICLECIRTANAVAARRRRTEHLAYVEGGRS